jgi:hypothetical protein
LGEEEEAEEVLVNIREDQVVVVLMKMKLIQQRF